MEDKEVLAKASLLMEVPRKRFVALEGNKGVWIRAITPWELGRIWKEYRDDEFAQALKLIELAMEEPKLTFEEVKTLKWEYIGKLVTAILEHSGVATGELGKPITELRDLSFRAG